jgi:hypothetical protein
MNLMFARALLVSATLVSGMLFTSVGPVLAATPTAQNLPLSSGQVDQKQWASIKAELDSSKLPRSTSVGNGVRTTTYTVPSGSMLSLSEPAGGGSSISPQLSVGGCGFLRLCVWLNRGDQLIVAAGSFAALTAMICLAGPAACVVASAVAAATFQAISNRGYICPNYMVVEILFSPGWIRGCY